MSRASSALYRTARFARTLEVLVSGDPARILRRVLNILLGRYVVSRLWLRPRRHGRIGPQNRQHQTK